MDTQRMKSAFPIVARIRKGEKKGPKNIGKDLNDRFRFDFYPGTEVVQAAFYKRYETFQPHEFRALIPDLTPFNGAWTWFNQAFLTRQVACANDQRYLWLIDPETGKYVVRDGEPFRPFIPKDEIPFKTASGKDILLKMKSVMFLHLLLHEVQGHFVTFELYSTSFYDPHTGGGAAPGHSRHRQHYYGRQRWRNPSPGPTLIARSHLDARHEWYADREVAD